MRKFILFSLFFNVLFSFSTFAQSNPAIESYLLGDFETAKILFEQSASKTPDISYYFLGEIENANKNINGARANYEKGIAADPSAKYSPIGMAKLNMKSDEKESTKTLERLYKKNKKEVFVVLEVAKAFYENGMVKEGDEVMEEALKNNGKSPWPYVYKGDRLVAMKKVGDAAGQYDQAIHFDPSCAVAYIKSAKVYKDANSTVAVDMLKNALANDPSNIIANKFLAELYFQNGFYPEAISSYEKYFTSGLKTAYDLRNFAASKYFSGDYEGALKAIQEAMANDPNNRVVNRLSMYSYHKLGRLEEAKAAGDKLFQLSSSTEEEANYLLDDYLIYGEVLKEGGKIDEAIAQFRKAIELDSTSHTMYKEIADTYAKNNRLEEAGDVYQEMIDASEQKELGDYLQMGVYYYQAAGSVAKSEDPAEKAKLEGYVKKANAAFSKVIELAPESYQGYYWRATTNTLLDPDLTKGLANTDYNKTIEILLEAAADGNGNKNRLVEAYRYFAIYYLYQFDATKKADDKDKSKTYAEKVLELNPEDATSKQILDHISKL